MVEVMPLWSLQYVDTFLPSEDKLSLKLTSKTMYSNMRVQPFAQHQTHFLSRSRYNAMVKVVEDEGVANMFHGHAIDVNVGDHHTITSINFSNHCGACLHRLPSNSLRIPTIYASYQEPDLVHETGHKCAFEPGRTRRVPSSTNQVRDASSLLEAMSSAYVVEIYLFSPDEKWMKEIHYACDEACVIKMEKTMARSFEPYFVLSYAVDGLKTLHRVQLVKGLRSHLVMLQCRLNVSADVSFDVTLTQDGFLRSLRVADIIAGPMHNAITLHFQVPNVMTGKDETMRHQSSLIKREYLSWCQFIHPHPFKDPNHRLNSLDVSARSLRNMPVYCCNNPEDIESYPHAPTTIINQAMRELGILPHIPVYFNEPDVFGNQLMEYDYTVNYMYLVQSFKWSACITIDPKGCTIPFRLDWITLCQATAHNFNYAWGNLYFTVEEATAHGGRLCRETLMDEMYVSVLGDMRSKMHVRLFLGPRGDNVITDPDFPHDDTMVPMEEDELLSDETLSDSESY